MRHRKLSPAGGVEGFAVSLVFWLRLRPVLLRERLARPFCLLQHIVRFLERMLAQTRMRVQNLLLRLEFGAGLAAVVVQIPYIDCTEVRIRAQD